MRNGPKFLTETPPACDDPRVIGAVTGPTRPGVPLTLVRHRDRPDLRGAGRTHREAAGGLLRHLTAEQDRVLDGWHREMRDRVIADVGVFLERGGPGHPRQYRTIADSTQ